MMSRDISYPLANRLVQAPSCADPGRSVSPGCDVPSLTAVLQYTFLISPSFSNIMYLPATVTHTIPQPENLPTELIEEISLYLFYPFSDYPNGLLRLRQSSRVLQAEIIRLCISSCFTRRVVPLEWESLRKLLALAQYEEIRPTVPTLCFNPSSRKVITVVVPKI